MGLPDGSHDDTFPASAVVREMAQATAVTLDADGRVLVAGQGPFDSAGAVVARLTADGVPDTTFGNAGTTWIDPPAWQAQTTIVNDMAAGGGGSLTVAGSFGSGPTPFAARLSSDGSADVAGAISMTSQRVAVTEGGAQAIVTVRRAGGKAGAVSVAYRAAQPDDTVPVKASPGTDYEEVTGELTWADGDISDREIAIPIAADDPPEGVEGFWVSIDSAQGGAALGGQTTVVDIAADGAPAGQIAVVLGPTRVQEGEVLDVLVERAYYHEGQVSVTLSASGDATVGQDFDLQPSVLTWADGEPGAKAVQITARTDSVDEDGTEQFVLTLSAPSGGAILGASTSTTVSIVDPAPESTSGGGSFGWATLLALCAAGLRRFRR